MGLRRKDTMSRPTTIFAAISVALLVFHVHGECATADPQKARKVKKSTPPTRNEHYVKQTFKVKDGTSIDYWVMSPAQIDDGNQYPLVLTLHGRGGNTEAATELGSKPLRRQFPCFVMAPVVDSSVSNWALPPGFEKKERKAMLPTGLHRTQRGQCCR